MPPKLTSARAQEKSVAKLSRPTGGPNPIGIRTSGAPNIPENRRVENTQNNHNIIKNSPPIFITTPLNSKITSITNNYNHMPPEIVDKILVYKLNDTGTRLEYVGLKKDERSEIKKNTEFIFYGFTINDIRKSSISRSSDNYRVPFFDTISLNNFNPINHKEIIEITKKKPTSNENILNISINRVKEYFHNFVLHKIIQYNKILTGTGQTSTTVTNTSIGLSYLQLINIANYLYDYMNVFIPKQIKKDNQLKLIYLITLFLKNILHQIKPHSNVETYIRKTYNSQQYEAIRALNSIYANSIYTQINLEHLKSSYSNQEILQNVFNLVNKFKDCLDYIYHISARLLKYYEIYSSTLRKPKKSIIEKIDKYAIDMINEIAFYCNDESKETEYRSPKCVYYRGYGYKQPNGEEVRNIVTNLVEEDLIFLKCYQEIEKLSKNFTNFHFLNNDKILYLEEPIYNNILCLYTLQNFTQYLNSTQNDKVEKSKNIFKLMPYVLFYYYKALVNNQIPVPRTGAGAGAGASGREEMYMNPINIKFFLEFSLELFKVYNHIIRDINNLIPEESANLNINNHVYKINKILYKTHNDLVNQILLSNNYIEREKISYLNIISQMNDIKKDLIPVYQNKNININDYNYAKSIIPNFNEANKEETYKAIHNEKISINRVINQLGLMKNVQEKLVPKYNMIKKREIPLNVKAVENVNHNLLNKHNDNHILLRKLLNNYNKPLNKYHNYIIKRKI